MEKLKENKLELKKSQFYRYIDILEGYKLIKKSKWKKNKKGFGYNFLITKKGNKVLNFLSSYFEK
ncbi:MAG: hypothetical protein GF353_00090 [Candidatus Lokiarchaeota archaeon]|nr:hypothetical protein [Candidatus Lokiarchaeota archaeon]